MKSVVCHPECQHVMCSIHFLKTWSCIRSMLVCHCHFHVNLEEFAFVTGCWLFHPSWHMCIYKRMFESENKTLTKEGVLHFLELYETKHLPNSLGFSEVRGLVFLARSSRCSNLWYVLTPVASVASQLNTFCIFFYEEK